MASRVWRFKPPIILCVFSVAFAAAQLMLVGIPGPCGGGGMFSEFIEAHPSLDFIYFYGLFTLLLASACAFLGGIWLLSAFIARLMERRHRATALQVDPTAQLP